ncbi:uncharacterized protein [Ptychodera flava]|uniref:uncharacterized protein n=1 Tax=Ptychodera flava TaxID=63121 RepID=UPI00396A784D
MVRYLLVVSCPVSGCPQQDKVLAWQCIHDGGAIFIDEHGYLSCQRYSHIAHINNWKFECGEVRGPHKLQKRHGTDLEGFSRAVIQGQPYLAKEAGTLWMKKLMESLEVQFGMSGPESPRRGRSPGRLRAKAVVKKIQSPRRGFAGQHLFYVTCPLSTCLGRNRLYHWECTEDQSPLYLDDDGWLTCETFNHRAKLRHWTFDCGDRRGSHGYRKFIECDFEGIKQALSQGVRHFDSPEEWIWPVIDSIAEQFGVRFVEDKFEARYRRRSEAENLIMTLLRRGNIGIRSSIDTGVQADVDSHDKEERNSLNVIDENCDRERDDEKESRRAEEQTKATEKTQVSQDNEMKVGPKEKAKQAGEGGKSRSSTAQAEKVEDIIHRYLDRPYVKIVHDYKGEREAISLATSNTEADSNRLRQIFVFLQKGMAKNWKSVLRSLPWPPHFDDGRLEQEISAIVRNSSDDAREQAYQGLLLWRNYYPRASEQKLLAALRNCELDSLVDEIQRMDNSKAQPSNRAPSQVFSLM